MRDEINVEILRRHRFLEVVPVFRTTG